MKTSYSSFSPFLRCFFIYVLFGNYLSVGIDASLGPQKRSNDWCADGLYQHESTTCCLCGIGQRLKAHCTAANPQDTQCELCEQGTYNNHPNHDSTCQRCTSCSHINANLEVETACTQGQDTKCRCKMHHYCISANAQECKLCSSCTECGREGVKVACTATNDTVCNVKLKERTYVWTGVGVACAVVAIIILGLWFRRNRDQLWSNRQRSNNPTTFEMEVVHVNIPNTDPSRYLPAIAEELGWKTMTNVATRSGMSSAKIESCRLDNPNDHQECTLQLLRMWVQEKGMDAMNILVQNLYDIRHNLKAEKVKTILLQN
ncbi:tumor necrosis factor receptor superfamily member 6 isoform X1 [Syngnathus acus]|uniref:tumor necrosis factor receptor superfamily member 6 isoform X1 n=1 Tax=Syngnathus acus TaxID=161584 RepID=UPI001885F11D|nr:tumor necrosis factor receptor superfamily member 6 isoform X1 [Syngnathus acus]